MPSCSHLSWGCVCELPITTLSRAFSLPNIYHPPAEPLSLHFHPPAGVCAPHFHAPAGVCAPHFQSPAGLGVSIVGAVRASAGRPSVPLGPDQPDSHGRFSELSGTGRDGTGRGLWRCTRESSEVVQKCRKVVRFCFLMHKQVKNRKKKKKTDQMTSLAFFYQDISMGVNLYTFGGAAAPPMFGLKIPLSFVYF